MTKIVIVNLAKNSVGFYQISKLACIPATLVLQYLLYKKKVSYDTKLSLFVILLGVGISTVAEVSINGQPIVNFLCLYVNRFSFAATGFFFAAIAILFTAQGQIFTSSSQSQMGLDSMQLLYHTSPQIAMSMFVCIFLFEDITAIASFDYSVPIVILTISTCFLAVLVNISNYLVIGKTSPITYQVVGHSKTCLVLILGFVIFSHPVTWRSIVGIATAMTGVVWYGEIKRAESLKLQVLPQYSVVPKA